MSFLSIPFRRATLLQKTSKPTQFFTKSYSSSSSTTAAATTSKVAAADPQALTGYRKYAQQFKNKPGSYMTTFAILHEVTAVAPFPFIYFALDHSEVRIPFPDAVVAEGNKFINKARVYYKYPPLEPDNRVMMNLVTTYCIVKALLPVRIAASVAMTPFFAERLVGPMVSFVRKAFVKAKPAIKP